MRALGKLLGAAFAAAACLTVPATPAALASMLPSCTGVVGQAEGIAGTEWHPRSHHEDGMAVAPELQAGDHGLSFGCMAAIGARPPEATAEQRWPGFDHDNPPEPAMRRLTQFRIDLFSAGRWIPPAMPLAASQPRGEWTPRGPVQVIPEGPTPRYTLVPPPNAFAILDFRLPAAPAYSPSRGSRRLYLDGTPGF